MKFTVVLEPAEEGGLKETPLAWINRIKITTTKILASEVYKRAC